MFRFVHTADLHLDAPLRSLALRDDDLFELVGTATRLALARIVDLCIGEQADALLIAGDLYDGDMRSMKTAAFLTAQMERLHAAGIRVFIIRGNHDAESVITRELALPPNVHVFTGHGGTVRLEDHDVAIHGVSFAKPHAPESLLPKYPAPVSGCFNIGLLHTSLAGAEGHDTYAPCRVADLQAHGYDYWALGHVHKRQVHGEAPYVIMPGMPQGRDIGEAGSKSVTLVTRDAGSVLIEERPTSVVEFNRVNCALDGIADWREALQHLSGQLKAAAGTVSDQTVLRVVLTGKTPLAWRMRRDHDLLCEQIGELARAIGPVWIEKIENRLSAPVAETDATGARTELLSIIRGLAGEDAFLDRAARAVEDLVADLPPEIRHDFGQTEAARAALALALLEEGTEEIGARMMADRTGGDA